MKKENLFLITATSPGGFVKILIAVLSMIPMLAFAGTSGLGKQIDFYQENGSPKFGVQVAHDVDKDWAISFAINGADLSGGKPIRVIAWRLWDKKSESFLSEWRTQVESSTDIYYSGTTAFSWDLSDPALVNEAIRNSTQLALVIYAAQYGPAATPTHFIDLGSYCSTNADHFVDLTSGQAGCGTLAKPIQPAQLPASKGKVTDVGNIAGDYCKSVVDLAQEINKVTSGLPIGAIGRISREIKLAKVLCNSQNQFIGFTEIKDQNIRAIVNAAAVEDAFARLYFFAREVNPALGGWMSTRMQNYKRGLTLFFNDSLMAAYPEIYGELRDKYSALRGWAVDLSNFYRSK